jgi:NAD(P)-dependent dehydrogenase (short-subunit alcohol dehydrogenase family)
MSTAHKNLHGLRAIVTGGTAGLGLALVEELTRRGATVGFLARDAERVRSVERRVPRAIGVVGDVAIKTDIHPIATQLVGRLGGVDLLIHNASSLGPSHLKLLADTECEELETAIATNVLGPHRLTRALLGALASSVREGRGGVVLSISSDAAVSPYATWGAYGASKAALHHASRVWDEERPGGVRFLSRDPGDMDTELHAIAVPDADRSTLKLPSTSARELIDELSVFLHAAGTVQAIGGAQ